MKRCLFFLPLLGLPLLGDFLGFYLSGRGVFRPGYGFLFSLISSLIVPFVIAAFFAVLAKVTWPKRLAIFFVALIIQFALPFTVGLPGATIETMGYADKIKLEYSADQLRRKFHAGTLTVTPKPKENQYDTGSEDMLAVADADIPEPARGRFQQVLITKVSAPEIEPVTFVIAQERGIICDSRKKVRGFFECSIGEGVHVYNYYHRGP